MDDVLGRATALTTISAVAGSVVGKVWSAEQARAGRVQHFLKQLLHDSWDYAAERSGRLTVGIRQQWRTPLPPVNPRLLSNPKAVYSACARTYSVWCF